MSAPAAVTALVALAFAAVHVFGWRMRFLSVEPRSRWLSAAGGVAVAYVFVHLLPELAAHQDEFREAVRTGPFAALEAHVYLIALLGLTMFYGLERMVKETVGPRRRPGDAAAGRPGRPPPAENEHPAPGVFWLHIASYGVYNALVGYLLLHREQPGLRSLLFYAVAMGLHFVVNDRGLEAEHGALYRRYGRWVVAGATLLGWALGAVTEIHRLLIGALFAFLAGGVVLNVLKEELPQERQSRFWAFAAGAAGYAALLLAV